MISDHEEIIPECEGCIRAQYSILTRTRICVIHPFPRIRWWFDLQCEDATHLSRKPSEDPIDYP
jgi:hypothetical protein